MSTISALSVSDLHAHVPVDHFDIVDGPSASRFLEILDELTRLCPPQGGYYVDQSFTLRTDASKSTFKRKLRIAGLFAIHGNELQFTAIFSGRVVSGIYNTKTRSGWFNLD